VAAIRSVRDHAASIFGGLASLAGLSSARWAADAQRRRVRENRAGAHGWSSAAARPAGVIDSIGPLRWTQPRRSTARCVWTAYASTDRPNTSPRAVAASSSCNMRSCAGDGRRPRRGSTAMLPPFCPRPPALYASLPRPSSAARAGHAVRGFPHARGCKPAVRVWRRARPVGALARARMLRHRVASSRRKHRGRRGHEQRRDPQPRVVGIGPDPRPRAEPFPCARAHRRTHSSLPSGLAGSSAAARTSSRKS